MKSYTLKREHFNIAMLGQKKIPSRKGGIEIVVEELASRMVSKGNHVTCYNRKSRSENKSKTGTETDNEYKGIRLRSVLTIDRKGLSAMTASITGAIYVAIGKYDIVHFHAEGSCAMIWLPKLFGKRCIVTIHGLDYQRKKWGKFARTYIKYGEKCAAKYADEIIVLSKGIQKYFLEEYGRETRFIPNGVNKPVIRDAEIITSKYNLKKDEYFLFLGRLVPEKGLEYLIEAFKQVKTSKKLVIAGESSDTDVFVNKIRKMAREDNRILFTGFIEGRELDELYSNTYVYILPSDLEGMALTLLEAMSYGNCCLVSDINECTSVVEDKALIFKKANVRDLQDKIQLCCNNLDLVKKYKNETASFICSKYIWDDVVDRTLRLYKEYK